MGTQQGTRGSVGNLRARGLNDLTGVIHLLSVKTLD